MPKPWLSSTACMAQCTVAMFSNLERHCTMNHRVWQFFMLLWLLCLPCLHNAPKWTWENHRTFYMPQIISKPVAIQEGGTMPMRPPKARSYHLIPQNLAQALSKYLRSWTICQGWNYWNRVCEKSHISNLSKQFYISKGFKRTKGLGRNNQDVWVQSFCSYSDPWQQPPSRYRNDDGIQHWNLKDTTSKDHCKLLFEEGVQEFFNTHITSINSQIIFFFNFQICNNPFVANKRRLANIFSENRIKTEICI